MCLSQRKTKFYIAQSVLIPCNNRIDRIQKCIAEGLNSITKHINTKFDTLNEPMNQSDKFSVDFQEKSVFKFGQPQ